MNSVNCHTPTCGGGTSNGVPPPHTLLSGVEDRGLNTAFLAEYRADLCH